MKTLHFFSTKAVLIAALALTVIFQSCKKNNLQDVTVSQTDNIAALQQAIANSAGTTADKVVYLKNEKQFVVDGDGYVTLEDARLRFAVSERATGVNGASQMVSYYTIIPSKVNAIKLFADSTVPDVWNVALDSAITNWNATGSQVKMQRVSNPAEATTVVTTNYTASATIASAAYPDYYGNPGNSIIINTYHNGLVDSKKIFAITHELGHNLGFSHTNGTYGYLISGTPATDPNSVMNSVVLYWNGFTPYDVLAVNTIYPVIIPETEIIPEPTPTTDTTTTTITPAPADTTPEYTTPEDTTPEDTTPDTSGNTDKTKKEKKE